MLSKIFCLLLIFLCLSSVFFVKKVFAEETVTLYPDAINNKAYKGSQNNALNYWVNPSSAATAFSSTDYTNIQSDNNVYVATSAYTSQTTRYGNVAHRFTFNLTNYNTGSNTIIKLRYFWDGYSRKDSNAITDDVMHKDKNANWIRSNVTVPLIDNSGFEFATTINNPQDYLINNIFEFGLVIAISQLGGRIASPLSILATYYVYLYSDFVKLEVSYTAVTKNWNDVANWIFNFNVKQWNSVDGWVFNLFVKQWNNVANWVFSLLTKNWNQDAFWVFAFNVKQWNSVANWVFSLLAKNWNQVAQWNYVLIVQGWHAVAQWVFELFIFAGYGVGSLLFVFLGLFLLVLVVFVKNRKT